MAVPTGPAVTPTHAPRSWWPRNYEAELLPGLPATGPEPLQFRATTLGRGREGLVVSVRSAGSVWVGNFQRGDGQLDGIYETPSPDHVCVIAGGTGYWVPVYGPASYEIVGVYPIEHVRFIPELGVVVFADFTDLAGYGASGKRWASGRASWDGIEIVRADRVGIVGKAWDATKECEVGFYVDPVTGELEGGAAPPAGE